MTEKDPQAAAAEARNRALFNLVVWAGALPVIGEFNRLGIPTLVLKSLPQVEELYGDAAGRATGDVDLVVPGQCAVEAMRTLARLGWFAAEQDWFDLLASRYGRDAAARRRPWHFGPGPAGGFTVIDLHSDGMEAYRKPALDPGIWRHARPVRRDGVEFLVLSPEDRLLFLCEHFFSDSTFGQGIPWNKLVDIQHALERDYELDWEHLGTRAGATGLTIFLHLACDLAAARAAAPITPLWRDHVPVAGRRRHAVLQRIVRQRFEQLGMRDRSLLWLLAHDRLLTTLPVWREMVLPNRMRIAADYLGFWPSWPRYVVEVSRIYVHRLSKTFRRTRP